MGEFKLTTAQKAAIQARLPQGLSIENLRLVKCAARIKPLTTDDLDPTQRAVFEKAAEETQAAGGPALITDGRPTTMAVVAWMAHEGVNRNSQGFIKGELEIAAKQISVRHQLIMDWNHSAVRGFSEDPAVIGTWYQGDFALDQRNSKWGIVTTGLMWAWKFPEIANQMLADQERNGFIEFSMACIASTVDYEYKDGKATEWLHNPVFFTNSALDVPPADPAATGNGSETPGDATTTELRHKVLSSAGNNDPGQSKNFTHNSKLAKNEPAWGSVDKAKLPQIAFARKGDATKKSTWGFPHHWVQNGSDPDKDGIYEKGTLYLHRGGLSAAWKAAQGARSGKKAEPAVIDHLKKHMDDIGMTAEQAMAEADAAEHEMAAAAVESLSVEAVNQMLAAFGECNQITAQRGPAPNGFTASQRYFVQFDGPEKKVFLPWNGATGSTGDGINGWWITPTVAPQTAGVQLPNGTNITITTGGTSAAGTAAPKTAANEKEESMTDFEKKIAELEEQLKAALKRAEEAEGQQAEAEAKAEAAQVELATANASVTKLSEQLEGVTTRLKVIEDAKVESEQRVRVTARLNELPKSLREAIQSKPERLERFTKKAGAMSDEEWKAYKEEELLLGHSTAAASIDYVGRSEAEGGVLPTAGSKTDWAKLRQ